MKYPILIAAAAMVALSACGGGGQSQSEQASEQLENAAAQSDPAAAEVLENAADQVSEGNMSPQEAMQAAGNAQAGTVGAPQDAPPSMQAQPNRTGQQTPPPKVPTGPGNSQ